MSVFIEHIERRLVTTELELSFVLTTFNARCFSPNLFAAYGLCLPPEVLSSTRKRQADFAAGRLSALLTLDDCGHEPQIVGTGQYREPLWPDGLVGSITHSAPYAAAIACPTERYLGIGIDIEAIVSTDLMSALTNLVVCQDEVDGLRATARDHALDTLLTLAFSAKESFFKAAFGDVRRYFSFAAVRVVEMDAARCVVLLRTTQTLSDKLIAGQLHHAYYQFFGNRFVLTSVALYR